MSEPTPATVAQLRTQTKLSRDLREIVRLMASQDSVAELADAVVSPIEQAFGADSVWLRLFSDDTETSLSASSGEVIRDPHLVISTHIAAPQLWRDGKASVIREGEISNFDHRLVSADHLLAHARRIGNDSILFTPIGAGERCFGALLLSRRMGGPDWSDDEYALALEFGRDLGAIIASIRALQREKKLVADLAELDQYKDALIAKVAHEFEHPLSAIVDQMGILGTQVVGSRYDSRLTGLLRRDALRMQRLVDNLLLLSQLADPNRPLNSRDVELGPLIRRVADLLSAAIPDRRVNLHLPMTPMAVVGDPMELERLVSNVLHNALKFAPPNGEVAVSLRDLDEVLELVITDQGIGISAADLPHIFDEFYRSVTSPAAQVQPGAGLGLAIVRRVVQRHHGQIEVDSTLGAGTSVRVTLPKA